MGTGKYVQCAELSCAEMFEIGSPHSHWLAGGTERFPLWWCPKHGPRPTTPPKSGLQEAEELIRGARNADYGSFADEAHKIHKVFNLIVQPPPTPSSQDSKAHAREHAMYMIAVKLVRESHHHKHDNIVDLMGYAQLYLDNCEEK